MKNADMPAMPVTNDVGLPCDSPPKDLCTIGLTKREMMAMHMMSAFMVGRESPNTEWYASIAVEATNSLLAELDKKNE
ncbi:MAG: hypothetical protein ACRCT2_09780 [Plesiomonas shigelloides]